ncbi:MAG: hypothetical protein ACI4UK_11355 [Floccifex sp.]
MKVSSIYKKINENECINNIHSQFWIYDFEEKIQNENGIVNKLITIKIFDRNYKSANQIEELTFIINGISLSVKNIDRKGELLKCSITLNVDEEYQNIFIIEYVLNGEIIYLPRQSFIQGLEFNGNEYNLNICKNLLKKNHFVIAPEHDETFWFCGCGYANEINQEICPRCKSKKDEMIEISNLDKEALVLDSVKNMFKVDLKQPCEQALNIFAQDCEEKYGIAKDKVLSQFDLDELNDEQQHLKKETIEKYLKNNSIKWNYSKKFEDNIDMYLSNLVGGIILKEDVLKYIDTKKLKKQYQDDYGVYQKQKTSDTSKMKKLAVLVSVIVVVSLIISGIFIFRNKENIQNLTPKGVTLVDTIENRKKTFVNRLEMEPEEYKVSSKDAISSMDSYWNNAYPRFKEFAQENDIENIDDLMNYYYFDSDISHIPDKVEKSVIFEKDNYKFRSLTEDLFLISKEEKLDNDESTIYTFIGDEQGNVIFENEGYYIQRTYENGNIVSEILHTPKGNIEQIEYNYDGDELTSFELYDFNSDSLDLTRTTSVKDGLPVSEIFYNEGGQSMKVDYEIDNNQIVASKVYNENVFGEWSLSYNVEFDNGRVVYSSDSSGNTEEFHYDKNGLLVSYQSTEENMIQRQFYDFDNFIQYEVTFVNIDGEYYISEIKQDEMLKFELFSNVILTPGTIGSEALFNSPFFNCENQLYSQSFNKIKDEDKYVVGSSYPLGTYEIKQDYLFVRNGPGTSGYEILKRDDIKGDMEKDNKAQLKSGTTLEISEVQHTSSGYWGKLKDYDNAWICLYYEDGDVKDREYCKFLYE